MPASIHCRPAILLSTFFTAITARSGVASLSTHSLSAVQELSPVRVLFMDTLLKKILGFPEGNHGLRRYAQATLFCVGTIFFTQSPPVLGRSPIISYSNCMLKLVAIRVFFMDTLRKRKADPVTAKACSVYFILSCQFFSLNLHQLLAGLFESLPWIVG